MISTSPRALWRRATAAVVLASSLSWITGPTIAHAAPTVAPLPKPARVALVEASHRMAEGKHDEAIKKLDEVAKLAPSWTTVFFNRGIVLEQKGDYPAAIAEYKKYAATAEPAHGAQVL